MTHKFVLRYTQTYLNKHSSLISKNKKLALKITKSLEILSIDPLNHSLYSHKVSAVGIGEARSSRVTGDIRIIWNYDKQEKLIILILNIGSHSGGDKVYK